MPKTARRNDSKSNSGDDINRHGSNVQHRPEHESRPNRQFDRDHTRRLLLHEAGRFKTLFQKCHEGKIRTDIQNGRIRHTWMD